jgi:4-hydroxybenzoate polyprenyltransferase
VPILKKLYNLLIYSSVWIALGAAAFVHLTYELLGTNIDNTRYTFFVFFSTISLYSFHRIIGLKAVKEFCGKAHINLINRYRFEILLTSAISLVAAILFLVGLQRSIQFKLLFPIIISLLYVLPVIQGKKRLRDFHIIKILLIGLTWTWVTCYIPIYAFGGQPDPDGLLMCIERFFFIVAITIPFDIRDLQIDKHTGVMTIPSVLGIWAGKWMSWVCLVISMAITCYLLATGIYPEHLWPAYLAVLIITGALISYAEEDRSDYYYSGLLDGTMILLAVLVHFLLRDPFSASL